jgi:hypothetical protein
MLRLSLRAAGVPVAFLQLSLFLRAALLIKHELNKGNVNIPIRDTTHLSAYHILDRHFKAKVWSFFL